MCTFPIVLKNVSRILNIRYNRLINPTNTTEEEGAIEANQSISLFQTDDRVQCQGVLLVSVLLVSGCNRVAEDAIPKYVFTHNGI